MLPFVDGPPIAWHFDNMLWSWFGLIAVVAFATARINWAEFDSPTLRRQYILHTLVANIILWLWLIATNLERNVWEVAVGWLAYSLIEYLVAVFMSFFLYTLYKACKKEWQQ